MAFGWRNNGQMRLRMAGLLICMLILVLLFACQADEPTPALPARVPATASGPMSPVATEGSEASTDTTPAVWPRYEATYYSVSYPPGWQVEEGFGGQYVVLHPTEPADAGTIGKIELAYLGYEVTPEDDLFEWFNLYNRVGGSELPERQILENRSAVQPDGTVTRRLHILNTRAQSRSQVILLTHGRLVLSLNGYTHDETMTELLRILADSIVFHPHAPTTKAELYPNEENLVTTLDEVLAIMQAPPPPESTPVDQQVAGMLSPLISPLPTPTEAPQIVRADRLPPVSYDLLYLSEGFLRVWDHQTGQVEMLVGPEAVGRMAEQQPVNFLLGPGPPTGTVLEYVAGLGGQIAVVTFQRGAAGVYPSTDVFLFERQTRQRLPLSGDGGEISLLTFSPDGNWIAWVALENRSYALRPPGLASPVHQTPEGQNFSFGSIYVAPATSPNDSRRVGSCDLIAHEWVQPCIQLFWSADSQQLVWLDVDTLWSVSPMGATAPVQYPRPVEAGEPHDLAPSGRYLLTSVPGVTEGSSLAVVDLHTQRTMAVGGTFEYVLPGARVLWLDDDRLLVAHHASLFGGPAVSQQPGSAAGIEIWRMAAPPHELLELEHQVVVPARPGSLVAGLRQIDRQRAVFALLNPDVGADQTSGLYRFDLATSEIHKLRSLTPMGQWDDTATATHFPEGLYWTPDASGLLIHDVAQQMVLFAPAAGNSLFEIGHLLGLNACCFTWVAPTVSTPLSEIDQTAQVTVPDAYTGAYHFGITYPTAAWRVEEVEELEGYESPRLKHLAIDGCLLHLRDGPRGTAPDAVVIEQQIAGLTWGVTRGGELYLFYTLYQPDKGISFFIRLELPVGASDEVKAACQNAAEGVLNTFTLLE